MQCEDTMKSTRRKAAAPSNDPDAELHRLNAEYRTFLGEIKAGQHRDAEGMVSDEARDRMYDLEKKIADTPATSYAGIGIKLLIAADYLAPREGRTTDELNLESALADAERLAERVS